jgi:hypothetical protein
MRSIKIRIGRRAYAVLVSLKTYGFVIFLVAVLGLVFIFVLWTFLGWQSVASSLSGKDRIDAETKAFQTLAQVLGGSFFLITAYFTWRTVSIAVRPEF